MTLVQAKKLREYVEQFVDKDFYIPWGSMSALRCHVRCHKSDDYDGGWSVRVYDNETGSIIEVGNINRSSVRGLVTFAKYGDM